MTLLFKSLKQPIVLGYIVAGFLASPNMPYMPSVSDMEGVHLWSEIGVIFLLFALGLEFSFKKILKMGAAPIVAAIAIIISMMYVGSLAGQLFGWSDMDCIYLGGMPFLWSLMRRGADSDAVNKLWYEGGRPLRIKITAFGILRLAISAAIIAFIIGNTLPMIGMYGIFAVIAIAFCIFISPYSKKRSDMMTKTFTENLNEREQRQK